ncbi:MAG TPA: hypothetical protein PKZ27_03110 [Rhodocyclaceae bacterium]|nr:hypothetical protein [Rhodocyclaceae bacterium]
MNTKHTPTTSIADALEEAKDVARMRLDHAFSDGTEPKTNALAGLQPSTATQVSGNTLFQTIDDLSSVGQIQVLRALANGALYAAVMQTHTQLVWDGPTEDDGTLTPQDVKRLEYYESLPRRIMQQCELYAWSADQLKAFAQSQFDLPMTLDTTLDFAMNNARRRDALGDELPDEVLEALGITRAQLKLIDADEERKQAKKDAELRDSIREVEDDLRAELDPLTKLEPRDDVLETFTAEQHRALFQKAGSKLQARVNQLLAIRKRYDGALGEAMLVSADAKTVDAALVKFIKRNRDELRDAA